jgi:hypothetical protein
MGFLTNLVKQKTKEKSDKSLLDAEKYGFLVKNHSDPDIRASAMEDLVKASGLSQKESANLMQLVTHMAGASQSDSAPADTKVGTTPNPAVKPEETTNPMGSNVRMAEPMAKPQSFGSKAKRFGLQVAAGALSQGATVREQLQRKSEERAQAQTLERERSQSNLRTQEDIAKEQRAIGQRPKINQIDIDKAVEEQKRLGELTEKQDEVAYRRQIMRINEAMKPKEEGGLGMDMDEAISFVSGKAIPRTVAPKYLVEPDANSPTGFSHISVSQDGTKVTVGPAPKPSSQVSEDKLPSGVQGWYQYIKSEWEKSKGGALSPEENKAAIQEAGIANGKALQTQVQGRQMTTQVQSELSGLGIGGIPIPAFKASGAPGSGTPAKATAAPGASATPSRVPTPQAAKTPAAKGAVQITRPDGQSVSFTPDELDRVEKLKAQLIKIGPGAGFGQALRVRFMRDLPLLEKFTGLSSEQLGAALGYRTDLIKSLTQSVTRYYSLKRLDDTIKSQAEILRKAVNVLDNTGSPVINRLVRGLESGVAGAPSVSQFQVALNAVTRDYAAAQSSGGLSNATIPISNMEDAKKAFPDGMTPQQAEGILSTVFQEVESSLQAQQGIQQGIYKELSTPLGGNSLDRTNPTQPKNGDTQEYNGATYRFNGQIWEKQKK